MIQNILSALSELTVIYQIAFGAVLLSFFVVLYYYLFVFLRVTRYHLSKMRPLNPPLQPISIVVIIKDDIIFLENGIHSLMSQLYTAPFQVVVVNYKSQNEATTQLLDDLKQQYPELYVTNVIPTANFRHTTKLAYTIGVKAAMYENIIFVSPLVTIDSENWLQTVSRGYEFNNIITGYVRIARSSGLVNAISRSHNIITSLLYLGRAVCGKPYMATEQFMGYTKSLFFKCKGFSNYLRLNRGENDLFIQSVSRYSEVSLVLSGTSTVEMESVKDFDSYISNCCFNTYAQRYYNFGAKLYLFTYNLFTLLFWVSAIFLVSTSDMMLQIAIAIVIFVKLLLLLTIAYRLSRRTKERIPYLNLILFDLYFPFESMLVWIVNRVRPSKDLWI